MKKTISKQFLGVYGIGLKTSLNLHKKIGLNSRKSPLKLKKNQQNYFKNQLNLIPNNKDLKFNLNKISKFLLKIKKSKKNKFYKDDNKKTKIKTDRKK